MNTSLVISLSTLVVTVTVLVIVGLHYCHQMKKYKKILRQLVEAGSLMEDAHTVTLETLNSTNTLLHYFLKDMQDQDAIQDRLYKKILRLEIQIATLKEAANAACAFDDMK